MTDFFTALQSRLFVAVEEKTKLHRDRLRIAAQRAADEEIQRNLMPFIVRHYMNVTSTPSDFANLGVKWDTLDPIYTKRRKKEFGVPEDIFWRRSGALMQEIKDADPIKAFGHTSVEAALASGDGIREMLASGNFVRQLVITPFPHVRQQLMAHSFAYLDKRLYEEDDASGFVYRKIANRNNKYRPMIGPAMLIFAKRNIARAVALKLNQMGYGVK